MLALLLLAGMGCASDGSVSNHEALAVRLAMKETPHDPTAVILLANHGTQSIGVSPTFLFEDHYVFIEIKGQQGSIGYPLTSRYEAFAPSAYRCIRPGGELTIEVRLKSWYPMIGGEVRPEHDLPQEGPHSFRLPPGQYEAKAVYIADDQDVRVACAVFRGRVESGPSIFEVR